jgi:hypothetical protein
MVSGVWGALATTAGRTAESAPETMGWWLVGYRRDRSLGSLT